MKIKKFTFLGFRFAVQAYGQGNANIIQIDENKGTSNGSFYVAFESKNVSSSSFQTAWWKMLANKISCNTEELHSILKSMFDHA